MSQPSTPTRIQDAAPAAPGSQDIRTTGSFGLPTATALVIGSVIGTVPVRRARR